MMIFVVIIHIIVCLGLIGVVLIQRGRGGGLVESLSGVESVLGTKTSSFLTRATFVLSVLFFLTSITLAFLSIKQSKSLMRNYNAAGDSKGLPLVEEGKKDQPSSEKKDMDPKTKVQDNGQAQGVSSKESSPETKN
ncbi:MAG: preprotein translocase subunit SecG [Candidatus Omnitrophica bacterium]|nr:preprotein translocase subunit SecG [Candidatus Omnitrophota bacterium]